MFWRIKKVLPNFFAECMITEIHRYQLFQMYIAMHARDSASILVLLQLFWSIFIISSPNGLLALVLVITIWYYTCFWKLRWKKFSPQKILFFFSIKIRDRAHDMWRRLRSLLDTHALKLGIKNIRDFLLGLRISIHLILTDYTTYGTFYTFLFFVNVFLQISSL